MDIFNIKVHLLEFWYQMKFVNKCNKVSIPFQTLSNLRKIAISQKLFYIFQGTYGGYIKYGESYSRRKEDR